MHLIRGLLSENIRQAKPTAANDIMVLQYCYLKLSWAWGVNYLRS